MSLEHELAPLQLPVAGLRKLLVMGVPAGFIGVLHARGDIAIAGVDLDAGGTFQLGGPDRRLMQLLAARPVNAGAVIAGAVAGIGAVLVDRLDGEDGR